MAVDAAIEANHVALWALIARVVMAVFQTLLVGKTGHPLPGTIVLAAGVKCCAAETLSSVKADAPVATSPTVPIAIASTRTA